MKGIIAINNLGYIGLNNNLPWRCSEDLKHFKALTLNCNLLVGYNTANTLPPLKDREVMVDSRDNNDVSWIVEGTDAPKLNREFDWCIGGKKTYEKYCHLFTELHISRINDNSIGDTMFPDLKDLNPMCKVFIYNFETNKKKIV